MRQEFCVGLLLHRWRLCCDQTIHYRLLQTLKHPKQLPPSFRRHRRSSSIRCGRPVPRRLALKGGDGARLAEERAEVRAAANDGVGGEAAEVALERRAPLAHEVVALYDLPLEDALIGA